MAIQHLATVGKFSYASGTSGTVIVSAGKRIVLLSCAVAAGGGSGSLTIAPGGAGQVSPAATPDTITILAGGAFDRDWTALGGGPLSVGTQLVFTNTSTYYVEYTETPL